MQREGQITERDEAIDTVITRATRVDVYPLFREYRFRVSRRKNRLDASYQSKEGRVIW